MPITGNSVPDGMAIIVFQCPSFNHLTFRVFPKFSPSSFFRNFGILIDLKVCLILSDGVTVPIGEAPLTIFA
jgi:hypothetical protein